MCMSFVRVSGSAGRDYARLQDLEPKRERSLNRFEREIMGTRNDSYNSGAVGVGVQWKFGTGSQDNLDQDRIAFSPRYYAENDKIVEPVRQQSRYSATTPSPEPSRSTM